MRWSAGAKRGMVAALAMAVLAVTGAIALAGSAELSVTLAVDRDSPQVGEPALFTATASEPDVEYEFRVDGGEPEAPDVGEPGRFTRAFSTPGPHTVSVRVSNESLDEATDSVTVTVVSGLRASIKQSTEHPGHPYTGETVTFTASATGGKAPISYEWDFGADGTIDASGTTAQHAFDTPGQNRTRLHARDAASPQHTDVAEAITTVAAGTRPPDPGPCPNRFEFPMAEIVTDGCFERTPSGNAWVIGDEGIRLNGIPVMPESGRTITVYEPTAGLPGGRITSSLGAILAGDAVLYRAPLDLALPDGGPGQTKTIGPLNAYNLATLFYLQFRGRFPVILKRAGNGAYSAEIHVTIQLPDPLRDAPPKLRSGDPTPKPVTNTAILRFENGRLRYENLRLEAPMAWYLAIPVGEICWAYSGAGVPERPCEPFTLDDEPYLECNSPVTKGRWDGTLRLELPTATAPMMGAFVSLSGGEIVAFGAARDNFAGPGLSLSLADFWGLNRLAFGVCRENPVQVRGDIGIAILPNRFTTAPLAIDGRWVYTAAHKAFGVKVPWTVLLDGDAEVFTHKVGDAKVLLYPSGTIFSLESKIAFADVFSVRGGLGGWLDAKDGRFTVEGRQVRACIDTLCSPGARGIVSTTGVGACIDVGKVKLFGKKIRVKAGGGTKWDNPLNIRVVSGRCGFNRYRESAGRARAAATSSFRLGADTPALAIRFDGADGPPRVRVTGPGNFDVSSPEGGGSTLQEGSFALVEDHTEGATHLILVNRTPGTYSVEALDASNPIVGSATAQPERPFTASARVNRRRGGRHVLRMRYRAPRGVTMSLVERGPETTRVLAKSVEGRPCANSSRQCFTKRFRPARGKGGRRTIEAVLERDGMPLETRRIATYRAPADRGPGRTRMRIRRKGSTVRIAWRRARRARSYAVVARLSDGRSVPFRVGRRCRTVALNDVGRDVRVTARVAGLDRTMRTGRYAKAKLRPGKRHAGKRKVKLRRACA